MLIKIIQTYWQICRLKLTPAKTPNNTMLTGILVVGYVFVKFVLFMVMPQIASDQTFKMVRQLIITTISLLGYTYLVLYVSHLLDRYVRSINCLFACSTIIEFMTVPVVMLLPNTPPDSSTPVTGPAAAAQLTAFFVLFVLAVWQIVVNVYIYQQSLSISQGRAFLVWLGLIATQMSLYFIGSII